MTSQRVEGTWISTGGYGRFRGEWVKFFCLVVNNLIAKFQSAYRLVLSSETAILIVMIDILPSIDLRTEAMLLFHHALLLLIIGVATTTAWVVTLWFVFKLTFLSELSLLQLEISPHILELYFVSTIRISSWPSVFAKISSFEGSGKKKRSRYDELRCIMNFCSHSHPHSHCHYYYYHHYYIAKFSTGC